MQAPSFCRSLMTGCPNPSAVSATYGVCQQSPCLKMMPGSSAPAMHLPCSHCLVFGGEDTPHSCFFGFSLCILAFPLVSFAASFAMARLVCALQPAQCSQAASCISPLLVAASYCKAAYGVGLQHSPRPSLFTPSVQRSSGGISCPLL